MTSDHPGHGPRAADALRPDHRQRPARGPIMATTRGISHIAPTHEDADASVRLFAPYTFCC